MTPNPNDPVAVLAWVASIHRKRYAGDPQQWPSPRLATALTVIAAWAPVVMAAQSFVQRDQAWDRWMEDESDASPPPCDLFEVTDTLHAAVATLEGDADGDPV